MRTHLDTETTRPTSALPEVSITILEQGTGENMMGKRIPIEYMIGRKFSRLQVVSYHGKIGKRRFWNCRCECGTLNILVCTSSLTTGNKKSCGCINKDFPHNFKHGMHKSRLYRIWHGMMERCLNPNKKEYRYYGGRGIKISEKWKTSKEFIDWSLENGYREDLEIDRIDNNGNYEPSNCHWATKSEQQNNTRKNVRIEYGGSEYTLSELSLLFNIPTDILRHRYKVGDRGEHLFRPVKKRGWKNLL